MKHLSIKSLIIAVVVLVSACNNPNNNEQKEVGETIHIEHNLGAIDAPLNPEKVVVFDIGALETLTELGVTVAGAPLDNLPQHLSQLKEDENIVDVGTVKKANLEKINALDPDLIIISGRLQDSYKELSKIAPTLFIEIDRDDYMGSYKNNTLLLAELYNKEAEAQEKLDEIDQDVQKAKEAVEGNPNKGLVVLYNNGKFSAYGAASRFGFMHDVLGLDAAVEDLEVSTHGQRVSNEFIMNANPDYLFIIDRNMIVNKQATNKKEIENALIQKTNAYKNGKIIYLNPEIWYISQGGLTSTREMIKEILAAI